MAEVEVEPAVRRRRKSRSARKATTWPEYWRGPEFGRHLFIAMGLIAVAYAGQIVWSTRMATLAYDQLWPQASDSEVRYMLGTPDAVAAPVTVIQFSSSPLLLPA